MAAEELLFIDIEPKSNISGDGRAEKLLWTRSAETFRFNFLPENSPALLEKTSPSSGGCQPAAASLSSLTGPGSDFVFNFQIPPVENMETTDTRDISSPSSEVREAMPPPPPPEVNPPPEPSLQSKAKKKKKKKKSGRHNPSDSAEAQQTATSAEDAELSAEEQLNRQLDWCIEQLECSMATQKMAPKQKEEASRALKTLRSSKAPLAKKRQVMRAMTGDYRKKMDEEKSSQYKLIQSEIASAQVKVVSKSPKKPIFHRRAEVKQTPAARETLDDVQDTDRSAKTQEETSAFVFTSSKEAFHFNFL